MAGVTCVKNDNINIVRLDNTILIEDLGSDPLDVEKLEVEVERLANALKCTEEYKNKRSGTDTLWKLYLQYLFKTLFEVDNFECITVKCIIVSHPHQDHFKLIEFFQSTFNTIESVILCGNPSYYMSAQGLMSKLYSFQSKYKTEIFLPALKNSLIEFKPNIADFRKAFNHDFTLGVNEDIGQGESSYCPKKRQYLEYLNSTSVFLPFTKYLELNNVYFAVFPLLNSNFVRKWGAFFVIQTRINNAPYLLYVRIEIKIRKHYYYFVEISI